jgi:uncharacterized beta-barrel protein YwiB (DUF1934 family)
MINDENETKFDAQGILDKSKLSFIDHEKQNNSILFNENSVEYIKTGNRFMHYTFELSKATKGVYRIDQFEFDFQIFTTHMDITSEHLELKFTLQQGDEIVGHHQLIILYKDDEED